MAALARLSFEWRPNGADFRCSGNILCLPACLHFPELSAVLLHGVPFPKGSGEKVQGEESQEPQESLAPAGLGWGRGGGRGDEPGLCLGWDFYALGQNCREAETMPGETGA